MPDTDELLTNLLPDPDIIGQSEYRAVHEVLIDGQNGESRDEVLLHALTMLSEVDSATCMIRNRIIAEINGNATTRTANFTIEPAGPEGYSRRGFVVTDDPKHPIPAVRDGDVTFLPYVGPNGEVGYQCRHADGRIEYLYLNPSTDEGNGGRDDGPGNNVFLYQGTEGDPANDGPHHFYYVFDPEDWDEPEGVNDSPIPLEPEDRS